MTLKGTIPLLQAVEILAWHTNFSNSGMMGTFSPDPRILIVVDTSADNGVILRQFQVDDLTVQGERSGEVG